MDLYLINFCKNEVVSHQLEQGVVVDKQQDTLNTVIVVVDKQQDTLNTVVVVVVDKQHDTRTRTQ